MVRAKKKPATQTQEILSPSEKQALMEQKQELEGTLREVENFGQGTSAEQLDKSSLKRQIAHIDDAIQSRTINAKGKTLDSLVRESRNIEEVLAQGMPTRYEMDHPAKCPGAVRKHMAWLSRNKEAIDRYRYIQKVVSPENPKSVEELRQPGTPRY